MNFPLPGVELTCSLAQWFWEVLEAFSPLERSLFLRFVWGRTRLPRNIADFRGRDFVLQVWCEKGSSVELGLVTPPLFVLCVL